MTTNAPSVSIVRPVPGPTKNKHADPSAIRKIPTASTGRERTTRDQCCERGPALSFIQPSPSRVSVWPLPLHERDHGVKGSFRFEEAPLPRARVCNRFARRESDPISADDKNPDLVG